MPKNQRVPPKGTYLSEQCGEDAFFARSDAMGVADGVGGWIHVEGADAALFARKLMHYACLTLEENEDEFIMNRKADVTALDILKNSYALLMRDARNSGLMGSCTALITYLKVKT
jgi:serine/threonine protein phosphatase PrpC